MEKPKVLYLPFSSHLYGDNKSLLCTLLGLKDRVTILVGVTQEGPLTEELTRNGIAYKIVSSTMTPRYFPLRVSHPFLHKAYGYPSYLLNYVRTYFQLKRIIKDFKPDLIHSNNSIVFSGAIMSKVFHIPHVWHIREYIDKDHGYRFPDKKFYDENRKTSHCIAITRGLFDHFGLSSPKDVHIYNGVFAQEDIPEYKKEKQKYFLYLGRITEMKGVGEMLEAFCRFCKTNDGYKLLLAGEGALGYMEKLQDYIRQEEILQNKVEFLGYRKDIQTLLQDATALIVPSRFEAMGRITLEAMMMGCFVIGRNTGGTKELLENDSTGILYDTIDDLVIALGKVAAMQCDELEKENLRALECAKTRYTNEINADKIFEFYSCILK